MTLSANQLFLARDRVKTVLEAHLEKQLALERANNIAQVLVFEVDDPADVALAMLRNQHIDNINDVVSQVAEAWYEKKTGGWIKARIPESMRADSTIEAAHPSRRKSEIRELILPNEARERARSFSG
ncbi:MAG: hypothetical protein JXA30_17680 [Deltaproteobacteria bacterium]|nr:hypothetical protein [Deltaproteobacteria bacterium]